MTSPAERTALCFGDSNTHGTVAITDPDQRDRLSPVARWPGVMAAALGSDWRVIEEGQPGRTTVHDDPVEGAHKNGLSALPVLLESHAPLDLVILMLGTNDLKARFSVTAADIGRSTERLGRLVLASGSGPGGQSPGLIVVAPAPVHAVGWLGEIFVGGAEKSAGLSEPMRAAAERLGAGFLDAGLHARVDLLDGVHLTEAGHAALGTAMADAVRRHFIDRS